MEWIHSLIFGEGVAHSVLIFSAVIMLGLAIGQIRVFGISCGIAGVLFSGLLFGHFNLCVNRELLEFMRDFGLALFVYTIGIQVGPALFASFRREGLKLNLLAASNVFLGVLVTGLIIFWAHAPIEVAVGVLSGAVTNTPGLGAAQQALRDAYPDTAQTLNVVVGQGYAIAYPFAIFGIIFTMLFFRRIFGIDLKQEAAAFAERQARVTGQPVHLNFVLSNPGAAGKTVQQISALVDAPCAFSHIVRDGLPVAPAPETILQLGDQVELVCARERREDFQLLFSGAGNFEEPEPWPLCQSLAFRKIFVTHPEACKSVGELDMAARHAVSITKVERAGLDLVAHASLRLQYGDSVYAVGVPEGLDAAAAELGDSIKSLEHPNILPIFLGLILGVFLGSLPIWLPGMPAPLKLGLAGGPLLAAIILSRIRQIGPLSWFLPHSANIAIRELGITFFLACVGLNSGGRFLETLTKGDGLLWILYGILITLIPILITGFFARLFFKMDYLSLCGLLSGSMTDPPALSFALQMGGGDAPSVAYASVYPLTMFLRILTAQLIVIVYVFLSAS